MGRRSDGRELILESAAHLFRRSGYTATTVSDITAHSGTQRGSLTYFFPGGKVQIAVEVATRMLVYNLQVMDEIAVATTTPAQFIQRYLDRFRRDFIASEFQAGCPCVPIALELARSGEEIRDRTLRFFTEWPDALAKHLQAKGLARKRAGEVALLVVAAIEGALVIAKVRETPEVFTATARQLSALVSA
jgi:AcrR family transcriptional regulator